MQQFPVHTPKHPPVQVFEGSSDRAFGFVFAGFFAVVGLLPLLQGNSPRLWAVVASCILLIVAVFAAAILHSLNRLWTKFGLVIHRIVGPVALAILFFGVVTPIGLLMRSLGKDHLGLRFDRNVSSYWILRTPPGPTAESLRNQF